MQVHAATPTAASTQLRIANFNVENLFDTVDAPGKDDERTTPSRRDYDAKLAKLSIAIADTLRGSDIIALQEVENIDVLNDLVRQPRIKDLGYVPVLVEGNDSRGIDTAYLYLPNRVRLESVDTPNPTSPKGMPDAGGQDDPTKLYSRPPLVATFSLTGAAQGSEGAQQITLINNHFKSKAGGQQGKDSRRIEQAKFVAGLVDAKRGATPGANVIVIGDLNSLPGEEPIEKIEQFPDGTQRMQDTPNLLPKADRYTYIFEGQKNLLDHVFVTPELHAKIAKVEIPHINSGGHSDTSDPTTPNHSSDHDPIITTFDLA